MRLWFPLQASELVDIYRVSHCQDEETSDISRVPIYEACELWLTEFRPSSLDICS